MVFFLQIENQKQLKSNQQLKIAHTQNNHRVATLSNILKVGKKFNQNSFVCN